MRVFGFRENSDIADYGLSRKTKPKEFLDSGERPRLESVPGAVLGTVTLEDGTQADAGRKIMRGSWNASLHKPLLEAYTESLKSKRPNIIIHKNKNSGLWDPSSDCTRYLERTGIRTLLFAGVNTDQCVMGIVQDAHARGFGTIFLKDACATDSPGYAQEAAEYNMCRNWGLLSSCKALATAADIERTESAGGD
jgi:nicotinamidase-related amidase